MVVVVLGDAAEPEHRRARERAGGSDEVRGAIATRLVAQHPEQQRPTGGTDHREELGTGRLIDLPRQAVDAETGGSC